jgi:hypothetical protein
MPGNPEECRQQAKRCLELATQATSPLAKARFESLAKTWARLAGDIALTNALLQHWGASDPQQKVG